AAPYYNLLDPHVQDAMMHVADELIERYGAHRSMGGLSVQLSAKGYAQLPPLEWGLDDVTIERFTHETGIEVSAAGPERFAARYTSLTGEHADAWRDWRCRRVVDFYSRLAA